MDNKYLSFCVVAAANRRTSSSSRREHRLGADVFPVRFFPLFFCSGLTNVIAGRGRKKGEFRAQIGGADTRRRRR